MFCLSFVKLTNAAESGKKQGDTVWVISGVCFWDQEDKAEVSWFFRGSSKARSRPRPPPRGSKMAIGLNLVYLVLTACSGHQNMRNSTFNQIGIRKPFDSWGGFFSHASNHLNVVWWFETILCGQMMQRPNDAIQFFSLARHFVSHARCILSLVHSLFYQRPLIRDNIGD